MASAPHHDGDAAPPRPCLPHPRQPPGEHPGGDRADRHGRRPAAPSRRRPATGPPKVWWAICGNSARGMPRIIAMRSTTNDISTTRVCRPDSGSRPAQRRCPSESYRPGPRRHLVPKRRAQGRHRRQPEWSARTVSHTAHGVDEIGAWTGRPSRSSTPASSGPMTAPAWVTVMFSELAAGSWSAGQHPRDGGRAGGRVDGVERLLHGRAGHSTHPDVVQRQRGLQPQQRRGHRQPAGSDDQQQAAIHRVGPGAAEQAEHDQQQRCGQPGKTHVAGVLGECVDLDRDRENGQVGADDGDDSRRPQPTEIGVSQRSSVGEKPRHTQGSGDGTRPPTTRIRLCSRSSRPCQNSISAGAMR